MGARDDALIRASSLSRAAYLRLLEARQEPAALLSRDEADGESRFALHPLSWTEPQTRVYFAETPQGLRTGDARILQPSGYTNGRPFWLIPSSLTEDRDFFLTTGDKLRLGVRPLPGLDSFLFRSFRAGAEKEILPPGVLTDAPPIADARTAPSAHPGDLVASQRFFERQRALDRQGPELLELMESTARDMIGLSLYIVSDSTALFLSHQGTHEDVRPTPAQLRSLSLYAERASLLTRAFPLEEQRVRAITGYDQNAGMVIVDLTCKRALVPIELGLLLTSVFVPFAAFFAFAHSNGWIHIRQFFLLLLLFSLISGYLLCREAYADYQNRTFQVESFLRDFTAGHTQGEQEILRAMPNLWKDFAFSGMTHREHQGAHGIFIITAGTQILALLGIIFLAPLVRLLRAWRGVWWCVPMSLLCVLAFLAFSGAIFIAFPEHAGSSSAALPRLADLLLTGILLLTVQIAIAFVLSFFLRFRTPWMRALLFAAALVPFFLSSILFEFLCRFIALSADEHNILWYGLRFCTAFPCTLFGIVLARRQISQSIHDAALLSGWRRWRLLPALPFFSVSYYLLVDAYPVRAQGIMETQGMTLTDLVFQGAVFMPLLFLVFALCIALICAQYIWNLVSPEPFAQSGDEDS